MKKFAIPGSFLVGALLTVAVDDLGAQTESAIVTVNYYTGAPPQPVLEIISPPDGAVFQAPAAFVFSAELLASTGDTGPVEFFVGTNSVGIVDQGGWFSATTPPSSIKNRVSFRPRQIYRTGFRSAPISPRATRSLLPIPTR